MVMLMDFHLDLLMVITKVKLMVTNSETMMVIHLEIPTGLLMDFQKVIHLEMLMPMVITRVKLMVTNSVKLMVK